MRIPVTFVDTRHLFAPLAAELIKLLRSLTPEQWVAPTSAGAWRVRDVVAHLWDGDLRRLSAQRDGHTGPPPRAAVRDYDSLMVHLTQLNASWVDAAVRLSPAVLTDLIARSSSELAAFIAGCALDTDALYPVAWAGQSTSPMWLDIAREYTERWHHQDQIREAVGAPAQREPEWLRPVIETSLFALPFRYSSIKVEPETRVYLNVRGPAGGEWFLEYIDSWQVRLGAPPDAACTIEMEDLTLARLLMHRLPMGATRSSMKISGEVALADPLRHARAVMV